MRILASSRPGLPQGEHPAHGRARHKLDHGGQRELTRRLSCGEMLGDAATDLRQHRDELRDTSCLARLAHLFPVGMIAILQSPGRVA